MTVDQLIAALTAAIDHPNPSPPPFITPGTASSADQGPIPNMIDRLRKANGNYLGAAAAANAKAAQQTADNAAFSADYAAWTAKRDAAFAAWDRAVRALETLLLARQASAPVDPSIHLNAAALDAAKQRADVSRGLAKAAGVSVDVCNTEQQSGAFYLNLLQSPPRAPTPSASSNELTLTSAVLSAVADEAQTYLNYLAIA